MSDPIPLHRPPFISAGGVTVNQAVAAGGTLLANTTYYADLGPGVEAGSRVSPHFKWDNAIVLTSITFESTNLGYVATNAAAASGWVAETGPTTITAGGGSAGQNLQHWNNYNAFRGRAVIVVGATGGVLELAVAVKGA